MEDSHSQGIFKEKRKDFGRIKRLRTQSKELHEAANLDSGKNKERKEKCIEQEESIIISSRQTDGVSSSTSICTDRQIVVEDNSCCAEGHDKLEKYLEDIYERECNFHIDKSEEVFIQNAVEQYVHKYIDDRYKNLVCPDTCDISHCQPELLKVGSFYEETKNKFPNEFDYIIVFGTAEELPTTTICDHIPSAGKARASYRYTSDTDTAVFVEFLDVLGQYGPAVKVSLCYNKGCEKEIITVDISVGVRVLYTEEIHKTKSIIKDGEVFHSSFFGEILKTGSFLLVGFGTYGSFGRQSIAPWKVSVTETEADFIKNMLSLTHKKVYRLLKYLINGNFSDKLLQNTRFSLSISSYNLKTAITHHHYQCTGNSPPVASCVLDVLNVIYCKITAWKVAKCSYSPNHETTELFPDAMITFQLTRKLFRSLYLFGKLFYLPSPGDFTLYRTQAKYNDFLTGPKVYTDIIAANFRAFIKRLITLKESKTFEKCAHMVNDSFLEMLLMVPAFSSAAGRNLLSDRYSLFYADHDRHLFEKCNARKTQNCPWCNFCKSQPDCSQ